MATPEKKKILRASTTNGSVALWKKLKTFISMIHFFKSTKPINPTHRCTWRSVAISASKDLNL